LGKTSVVTPTRVGGTRWLTHTLTAITKLWQLYEASFQHLCQVKLFIIFNILRNTREKYIYAADDIILILKYIIYIYIYINY
jgi:hypothetical protein